MMRKLAIGCGGVLLLLIVLAVIGASRLPTISPGTAGTPGPAASPQAHVGDQVRYPDGWSFVVQGLEDQQPPAPSPRVPFTSKPATGMRFVVVTLRFTNGTGSPTAPLPRDFKLQDSNGVRRDSLSVVPERGDALKNNQLAPGGFVVGTLVFEAPVNDRRLVLVYQPRLRTEVQVQLY